MDLEWSSGCGVQILARKKDCNIATTEVEADLGEESLKRALFQKTSTLSNTQTAWNAIGSWGETRTWQFICHGMTSMTLWYPPWRILLHWSSSGSLYLYHLALCGVTQKPARVDRWTQAKCVLPTFPVEIQDFTHHLVFILGRLFTCEVVRKPSWLLLYFFWVDPFWFLSSQKGSRYMMNENVLGKVFYIFQYISYHI